MGRPASVERPSGAGRASRADREHYAAWRRGVESRFRVLSAGPVSDDAVERHVQSLLAGRAAWAPADDFSHVFADSDLAAQRRAPRRSR